MAATTGVGLGGPQVPYPPFLAKAQGEEQVARPAVPVLTGLGLGGSQRAYRAFQAKVAIVIVPDDEFEQLGYWAHRHKGARPIRLGSPDTPDRFEIVEELEEFFEDEQESLAGAAYPAGVSMWMAAGKASATGVTRVHGTAYPAAVEMWTTVGRHAQITTGSAVRASRRRQMSDAELARLLLEVV